MGALHAGHISLIQAARRDDTFIVVSIFVNPTQFAPGEDYAAYPRRESEDLEKCRESGVGLVFTPPVEAVYPADAVTTVRVARVSETLCGPHRPGHFDGVATIVTKLFNIVQPDSAYFGQKDAQQLAVIRRLTRDLDLPIEIVGCPIVREPDGLALSSRNRYLDVAARRQATCLHRALQDGRRLIQEGETAAAPVTARMRKVIEDAGSSRIDYVEAVDPASMQPMEEIDRPALLAIAAHIGGARLIDNLLAEPPGQ